LITKIITKSIGDNNFSIKDFYCRRIKRILPVYFLVSSTSLLFAWLLFFPKDLIEFANSLLSSTFFYSNFYFWKTSGYFSSAIELKPLVHTWSLSVEEQFYVFWPLVLMIIYKFKREYLKHALILSFVIISILFSYFLSKYEPVFAYYSIFTRAFELGIGAITAIYAGVRFSDSKVCSYLGAILILLSLIVIDKQDSFPGIIAIFPCLGAALIIVSGKSNTLVVKALEMKIAVSIGLVSYSLYMWHWPILAFAKYYYTNLNYTQLGVLFVVMLLLSYLTRYTIEKKFISSKMGFKQSFTVLFALPALIFSIVIIYINLSQGVTSRFSESEIKMVEETYSREHGCSKERHTLELEDECYIKSPKKAEMQVLLWGDSHANHFKGFFEEAVQYEDVDIYKMSFPGCPPISGIYRINRSYSNTCYKHNIRVMDMLQNTKTFDAVVLAANWVNYPLNDSIADDKNMERSVNNSHRAFYENLEKQIAQLSDRGLNIIILNAVPNFDNNASQCQLKNLFFGYPEQNTCVRPVEEVNKRRESLNRFLDKMLAVPNVTIYDFQNTICKDGTCKSTIDNHFIYSDFNHLSDFGSKYLYKKIFLEKNVKIFEGKR